MRKLTKTSITLCAILFASTSAFAQNYKLELQIDATQSAEQNFKIAAQKVEKYCKIMVRRDARIARIMHNRAIEHCNAQLMDDYVNASNSAAIRTIYAASKNNASTQKG